MTLSSGSFKERNLNTRLRFLQQFYTFSWRILGNSDFLATIYHTRGRNVSERIDQVFPVVLVQTTRKLEFGKWNYDAEKTFSSMPEF